MHEWANAQRLARAQGSSETDTASHRPMKKRWKTDGFTDSPSPKGQGVEAVAVPSERLEEADEAKLAKLAEAGNHTAHIKLTGLRTKRANAGTAPAADRERSEEIENAGEDWLRGRLTLEELCAVVREQGTRSW